MSFTAGPNGFGLWSRKTGTWTAIPGAAMRCAQNPNTGALTVVNVRGEIWQSAKGDGSDWIKLDGSAVDVCDGPSGLIVVGTGPA